MKIDNHEILGRRKRQIEERLKRKSWTGQREPMLRPANIVLEMSERDRAIGLTATVSAHFAHY